MGFPVVMSKGGGPWNLSISSASAGSNPWPLSVTTWTTTGPGRRLARTRAPSMDLRSCPSMGPEYLIPRSSKKTWGMTSCFMPVFSRPRHLVGRLAHRRNGAQETADPALGGLVTGIQAKPGEVVGQSSHGGGVGASVVVENDGQIGTEGADVVEGFIGHPAGQGAVADHHHHLAGLGRGDAGPGQDPRRS